MRLQNNTTFLSATDLSSHFECHHKTTLALAVAEKKLERPRTSEIEREILERRGREHESRVVDYYAKQGLEVVNIGAQPMTEGTASAQFAATLEAMRRGAPVIYQGALLKDRWVGRPDFLLRGELRGSDGKFKYEPLDAKLARTERAKAVLQLCVYADLLEHVQGARPERIWLALGAFEIQPKDLRTDDYFAYYGRSKGRLEEFLEDASRPATYPEPCEHCDVCEWWRHCETRREKDDHLSLVAGITRRQRGKLEAQGVTQLAQLATLPTTHAVDGIDEGPFIKIQRQARLQAEGRAQERALYELLTDGDPGTGLELLPEKKPGDLFLDLEGDAFVFEGGLEYLFGLLELGQPESGFGDRQTPGEPRYLSFWATNRAEEKVAFEAVMDRIMKGLDEFPNMHVFHFGHRENDALKKLSCRHATREDQVDKLLRRGTLVDLHTVVRQGVAASVDSYSLKALEALHEFERLVERRASARAMQLFGWWLETADATLNPDDLRRTLAQYNEEDCRSTWKLREWLEERRSELEASAGRPLGRPVPKQDEDDSKKVDERNAESTAVVRRLLDGLPANPRDDDSDHKALRLLADLVGWHWRELKSSYWDYHEARKVPPSEWLESRYILAGLEYQGVVRPVDRSEIHRYTFPDQEHAVRKVPEPEIAGEDKKKAKVVAVGADFIEIKRGTKARNNHPAALRPGRPLANTHQERQLLAVAKSIADDGLGHRGKYAAARDLLVRRPPRCGQAQGSPLVRDEDDTVDVTKRLCLALDQSVLAIQGPPGSGKTFRAVEAILTLVRQGKTVGVTANSHQVILGVLKKVHAAAKDGSVRIHHMADPDDYEDNPPPFDVSKEYADVRARLDSRDLQVVGGTSFAWTRPEFEESLDVLFVDEAGQISLANALAVSTAAKSLVLLGDPAQLEQPQKGAHPPGADASALEHLLGNPVTIEDRGVFLPETRRLHPAICKFTSSVFYEGRLKPMEGLEQQSINGVPPFTGSGLRVVSVNHEGNTNRSEEEVDEVVRLVNGLLGGSTTFTDNEGATKPLEAEHILVVAPYNAQVGALKHRLPGGILVGTVDKFQGKEAPIVIYSMTTSTGEEAPRGLEFLFSLNRLNVATSRAKTMVILVASEKLTDARCRTPQQLKLVNALCDYLERCQTE